MKWYGSLALVFFLFLLAGIVYTEAHTDKVGFALIPFAHAQTSTVYFQDFNGFSTFEDTDWQYYHTNNDNGYSASISGGSVYISGQNEYDSSLFGMEKTFDLSSRNQNDSLYISFDWKAESNFSNIAQANFIILDENSNILYRTSIDPSVYPSSSFNTDWQSFVSEDLSAIVKNDIITLRFYLLDIYSTAKIKNWYDNILISEIKRNNAPEIIPMLSQKDITKMENKIGNWENRISKLDTSIENIENKLEGFYENNKTAKIPIFEDKLAEKLALVAIFTELIETLEEFVKQYS